MLKKLIDLNDKILIAKKNYNDELDVVVNLYFKDTFTLLEEIGFIQNDSYDADYFFTLHTKINNKNKHFSFKLDFSQHNFNFYINWKDINGNDVWESFSENHEENILSLNKSIGKEFMKYKPYASFIKLKRIIDED